MNRRKLMQMAMGALPASMLTQRHLTAHSHQKRWQMIVENPVDRPLFQIVRHQKHDDVQIAKQQRQPDGAQCENHFRAHDTNLLSH